MRSGFLLATLLLALPSLALAASKPKVVVLAHGPAVPGAALFADEVSGSLIAGGYPVLSRDALYRHLTQSGAPDDPLKGVRAEIGNADKRYLDLDLDGADTSLRAAEAALSPLLGDPEAVDVLRGMLERRALTLLTQGRTDAAAEKLNLLYLLDAEYKPDPRLLSPQYQPAFEKARKLVATTARGTLVVGTAPSGADVYVDGRWAGASPATVEVRAGPHVVQVRLAGHLGAGATVAIDPNVRIEVPFRLQALAGADGRRALSRAVSANVLPGPRSKVADEVRALTGADAIVILIVRATADGGKVSSEIYRADQIGAAARTPESSMDLGSSAVSREIRTLLEAPAVTMSGDLAPVFATRRPPVKQPLFVGIRFHAARYYGTGWNRMPPGSRERMASGGLAFPIALRIEEQKYTSVDIAFTPALNNKTACLGPEASCIGLQINQFTLDLAPRLEVHSNKFAVYTHAGIGAYYTTITTTHPINGISADSSFAAGFHGGGGVAWMPRRRFRIYGETKLGLTDVPSPSLQENFNVKSLNLGGYWFMFGISTRL